MKEKMVVFNNLIIFAVVGDSLNEHVGMKFSTYDVDNDNQTNLHCAAVATGGWWYNRCYVFF